jgi:hypothetical protein
MVRAKAPSQQTNKARRVRPCGQRSAPVVRTSSAVTHRRDQKGQREREDGLTWDCVINVGSESARVVLLFFKAVKKTQHPL